MHNSVRGNKHGDMGKRANDDTGDRRHRCAHTNQEQAYMYSDQDSINVRFKPIIYGRANQNLYIPDRNAHVATNECNLHHDPQVEVSNPNII
jgi:hypothetical protein